MGDVDGEGLFDAGLVQDGIGGPMHLRGELIARARLDIAARMPRHQSNLPRKLIPRALPLIRKMIRHPIVTARWRCDG